jgi:N-terminal domain on NACHT_NTPase and P-loop NTPases
MSGFEVLSAVAAAAQLAEQGLKIVNLYFQSRDAPESINKRSVHLEQLIEIARLVENNQPLQTALVESTLRQCLEKATKLREILSKLCAASGDGKAIKWKKTLAGVAKEKEILALLADLEREKSSLMLCISTIDS